MRPGEGVLRHLRMLAGPVHPVKHLLMVVVAMIDAMSKARPAGMVNSQ